MDTHEREIPEGRDLQEFNKMFSLVEPLRSSRGDRVLEVSRLAIQNDPSVIIPKKAAEDSLLRIALEPYLSINWGTLDQVFAYEAGINAATYFILEQYAKDLRPIPYIARTDVVSRQFQDASVGVRGYNEIVRQVPEFDVQSFIPTHPPVDPTVLTDITNSLKSLGVSIPPGMEVQIEALADPDQVQEISHAEIERIDPYKVGFAHVFALVNMSERTKQQAERIGESQKVRIASIKNTEINKINYVTGDPPFQFDEEFIELGRQYFADPTSVHVRGLIAAISASKASSDQTFLAAVEAYAQKNNLDFENFRTGAIIMHKIIQEQYVHDGIDDPPPVKYYVIDGVEINIASEVFDIMSKRESSEGDDEGLTGDLVTIYKKVKQQQNKLKETVLIGDETSEINKQLICGALYAYLVYKAADIIDQEV